MKVKTQWIQAVGLIVLVTGVAISFSKGANLGRHLASELETPLDYYTQHIQPIFKNKCVSCHGCSSSPCELKLDSFAAVERGANQENQPFGPRLSAMPPSRMKDATTVAQWRANRFFPVIPEETTPETERLQGSLLYRFVKFGAEKEGNHLAASPEEMQNILNEAYALGGRSCPKNLREFDLYQQRFPNTGGMPLLLPALESQELDLIEKWIQMGAPGPSAESILARENLSRDEHAQVSEWEGFLNASASESPESRRKIQLVARYIYEHVFLGHVAFNDAPGRFFELVRSRTKTPESIQEIVTQTPMQSPGSDPFYYRFKPVSELIVQKSHLVWQLYPQKLARYRELFFETPWAAPAKDVPYGNDNPFQNFEAIPAKSRAKFLLDESKLIFNGMIRGPVCTGEGATFAIRDQFWIFFANPETDITVLDPRLGEPADGNLNFMFSQEWLGFATGEEKISAKKIWDFVTKGKTLSGGMEKYRREFEKTAQRLKPRGYSANDIWRADDPRALNKRGAVLTIFRHGTSSTVLDGAVGEMPPTNWFMTYAGIERLYYTLAAQFKYWGDVGHRAFTWSFMSELRQEYEDEFLAFLPWSMRKKTHDEWNNTSDSIARAVVKLPFNQLRSAKRLTQFQEFDPKTPTQDLIQEFYKHLGPEVMGPFDGINTRITINQKEDRREARESSAEWAKVEGVFAQLAARSKERVGAKPGFATYFPDATYVRVRGAEDRLYSLLVYKGYDVHNYIAGQAPNRNPSQDYFSILRGIVGDFPNLIVDIAAVDIPEFAKAAGSVDSEKSFQSFIRKYGLLRKNPEFWKVFHEVEKLNERDQGVEAGLLDLNYYLGLTH